MATWDNYPPPPRRSRSRSPGAKYPQRAAYPDSRYPDYRSGGDWESYDRPYGYERDSPTDARRPRSRSPAADGKKRRRSMSPWDRERFEPRPRHADDYDTHSRGYGGYSPRRGQYPPRSRAPPDPRTFDFPASLKQFADWFRYCYPQQATEEDNLDKVAEHEAGDGSKPRNGIRTLWEKYKKDFSAAQLQTMFDHHRKSPWFVEKYDPSMLEMRKRVRKVGWKGRLVAFLHDLDAGKFDPDFNESEQDKNGKDSATNGEVRESSGMDDARNTGDDDMQFNMDADDEPVDNDAPRTDGGGKVMVGTRRDNRDRERGEEIEAPAEGNQVMIRTIPPDIGRVKLEEACRNIPGYVYLALGDPMQKRNFYRAGWLRFDDNADMGAVMSELSDTKIEGFKLHVSHITRPFTNRVRYAPEVASKPDRLEKDLANVIALANLLEEEAAQLRQLKVNKATTKPMDESTSTDEIKTEPNAEDATPEDDEEEPMEKSSDAIERRVERIMSDMREQGILDIEDEAAVAAKKTVITLDLYLEFLRAAFHTCYYCAVTTDHAEELHRKCLKHVRKPLSKLLLEEVKAAEQAKGEKVPNDEAGEVNGEDKKDVKKEAPAKDRDWKRNDERWLDWLDSKVALLINRDGVDPVEYGGKSYDEELSKAVEQHLKQEDESKYRCKVCSKLFKATSFVEKHIANKHGELVKVLDDIPYFNNFALDPHRIQPLTHPPPQIGNSSQAPPPQAYGVQLQSSYSGDFGRQGGYYPPHGYQVPAVGGGNGYWGGGGEHYGGVGGNGGYGYPPPIPRRERRLSDRISNDYVPEIPAGANLPAKPVSALDSALGSGNPRRRSGAPGNGLPPPPPPDAKEDPRAAAGKRVSYHDMDLVAEGDVELSY